MRVLKACDEGQDVFDDTTFTALLVYWTAWNGVFGSDLGFTPSNHSGTRRDHTRWQYVNPSNGSD